jgi:MFS transporter, CP family, cyanate transporter
MTTVTHPHPRWLVLTALSLVALNLRIALSSVPTVTADIQAATGWSSAAIGALTTIPVVCMGAFALLVPRIAERIGRRHTVALALLMLTVALAMRLAATVPGVLPVSVFLAGVGIALAAGLVPKVVREQLPHNVGAATGLWTAAMMSGAALGGALTVPIAEATGSWTLALAIWAVPAAIALVVWWVVERGREAHTRDPAATVRIRELPWRDRRAWSLTLYLTMNSIVFYTALAWLAPSFVDRGWTQADAGFLLGVFTASQIVAALFMPWLAERAPARRLLYAATVAVVLVTVLAVGWIPSTLTVLVVVLFGAALGGGFAMGLALLSEYATDGNASTRLTAMAFSVTYLTASLGPLIAGALLDAYDSWGAVFAMLAIACGVQFATIPALRRSVRIS